MATAQFSYPCSMQSGFAMIPSQYQRVGYVTSLNGFGLGAPFAADLQVSVPFNTGAKPAFAGLQYISGSPAGSAKVVGVINSFSWNGGVSDAISLGFYVSQQNADQIKALLTLTLKTTAIKSLAWWIVDYDTTAKMWFEKPTHWVAGRSPGLSRPRSHYPWRLPPSP